MALNKVFRGYPRRVVLEDGGVGGFLVTVQDIYAGGVSEEMPLDPRLGVINHSPDGFMWGYGGSGPAQLALAIMIEIGICVPHAIQHHQQFKWDVIAKIPTDQEWSMTTQDILEKLPAAS